MSASHSYRVGQVICSSIAKFACTRQFSQGFAPCVTQRRHLWRSKSTPMRNILYTAVCVERTPVIMPDMSPLEQKFTDLSAKVELENSYLSDHELRLQREEKAQQKAENDDPDEGQTETALDMEDKWDVEYKRFSTAPCVTEADQGNDLKSLDRKLDTSLYLLVKQKIEGRDHWVLPQATWKDGETMRQTAERALKDVCGGVKATFFGNAPCAVAKYKPKNPDEERGIKLFFFKARFREGTVTPNTDYASDFMWVTKDELPEYCHSGYRKNLKSFIS